MTEEMTLPELTRRIESMERRHYDYVSKDVYERDIREIRDDTAEIKDTLKWSMRLLVGQLAALLFALLLYLLQQVPV